jgi:hypothetical protein
MRAISQMRDSSSLTIRTHGRLMGPFWTHGNDMGAQSLKRQFPALHFVLKKELCGNLMGSDMAPT